MHAEHAEAPAESRRQASRRITAAVSPIPVLAAITQVPRSVCPAAHLARQLIVQHYLLSRHHFEIGHMHGRQICGEAKRPMATSYKHAILWRFTSEVTRHRVILKHQQSAFSATIKYLNVHVLPVSWQDNLRLGAAYLVAVESDPGLQPAQAGVHASKARWSRAFRREGRSTIKSS